MSRQSLPDSPQPCVYDYSSAIAIVERYAANTSQIRHLYAQPS